VLSEVTGGGPMLERGEDLALRVGERRGLPNGVGLTDQGDEEFLVETSDPDIRAEGRRAQVVTCWSHRCFVPLDSLQRAGRAAGLVGDGGRRDRFPKRPNLGRSDRAIKPRLKNRHTVPARPCPCAPP
jgi:hypothetical protein